MRIGAELGFSCTNMRGPDCVGGNAEIGVAVEPGVDLELDLGCFRDVEGGAGVIGVDADLSATGVET